MYFVLPTSRGLNPVVRQNGRMPSNETRILTNLVGSPSHAGYVSSGASHPFDIVEGFKRFFAIRRIELGRVRCKCEALALCCARLFSRVRL